MRKMTVSILVFGQTIPLLAQNAEEVGRSQEGLRKDSLGLRRIFHTLMDLKCFGASQILPCAKLLESTVLIFEACARHKLLCAKSKLN